ncbi:hypothetical protein RND71_043710 [Anisodus tanguticus]|uniref:NADP-dependent oxidoreductase domain-containing protein n=1 Tax=Anisodus tanguticus TaxID=243964 RepID=A0AAE1QNX5_9SOLA|nr:hypothetical protein RND71_043710 [Anisodus tanguticus]
MVASIPILDLNDDQVYHAVVSAVKDYGYRHLDCALAYRNEKEVGKALKFLFENNVIKREEIFVVSKLWSTYHSKERVPEGFSITLKDLGLDYIDLYLMHMPLGFKEGDELFPLKDGKLDYSDIDYLETYKAMLELKKTGKVKSIGVSNFSIQQIERLIEETGVAPAVNQIECHPYLTQKPLVDFCFKNNIAVTAYSPLGTPDNPHREKNTPELLEDPVVKEIALKNKKTPAQVLIKFHLNRKTSVIPKSVTPERIKENIDILDFELSSNDMQKLEALDKDQVYHAVISAVKDYGYRHLDCALIYQNEEEVGKALKFLFENNVIKREEIFVVSKLWSTYHSKERVPEGLSTTLKELGLDYIDLYLMHMPLGFKEGGELFPQKNGKLEYSDIDYLETYKAMLELKKTGKVKSIGVSNFSIQQIERLIEETGVAPAVNQIECHPYLTQKPLVDFCLKNNISITAFSPIGRPGNLNLQKNDPVLLEDPVVKEIALKNKKTPAQVLIKFHLNRKTSVIPKSVTPERIKENIDIFDFELSSDDMQKLEALDKGYRFSVISLFSDHPYYPW